MGRNVLFTAEMVDKVTAPMKVIERSISGVAKENENVARTYKGVFGETVVSNVKNVESAIKKVDVAQKGLFARTRDLIAGTDAYKSKAFEMGSVINRATSSLLGFNLGIRSTGATMSTLLGPVVVLVAAIVGLIEIVKSFFRIAKEDGPIKKLTSGISSVWKSTQNLLDSFVRFVVNFPVIRHAFELLAFTLRGVAIALETIVMVAELARVGLSNLQKAVAHPIDASQGKIQWESATDVLENYKNRVIEISEGIDVQKTTAENASRNWSILNKDIEDSAEALQKANDAAKELAETMDKMWRGSLVNQINAKFGRRLQTPMGATEEGFANIFDDEGPAGAGAQPGTSNIFGLIASLGGGAQRGIGSAFGGAGRNGRSGTGIFGGAANLFGGIKDAAVTAFDTIKEATDRARAAVDPLGESFLLLGDSMAQGFDRGIEAVINGEQSFGQAMAGMARSAIASVASRARVEALSNLAQGLAASALGLPNAGQFFAAAKMWGVIAAVSTSAQVAIGGGSAPRASDRRGDGFVGSAGGRRGAGGVSRISGGGANAQPAGVNLTVNVQGHVLDSGKFGRDVIQPVIKNLLGDRSLNMIRMA